MDGPALGGGTGLVANCHIVIASEKATFGLTEIRLGLWPFLVYRPVAAAVGERRTLEMALSGRILDAKEAEKRSVWCTKLRRTRSIGRVEVAETIAGLQPDVDPQRDDVRPGSPRPELDRRRRARAAWCGSEIFESDDFREGIQAFREKRKPKWPSLARAADKI